MNELQHNVNIRCEAARDCFEYIVHTMYTL